MIQFSDLPKTNTENSLYVPDELGTYLMEAFDEAGISYRYIPYDQLTHEQCDEPWAEDDLRFYEQHQYPNTIAMGVFTSNIDRLALRQRTLQMFGTHIDPDFQKEWNKTHTHATRQDIENIRKQYR